VTEVLGRVLAQKLYDAYGRGDFAAVADMIHEDIDWAVYNPVRVFAFSGPRHGKAEVLGALAAITKAYKLLSYQPELIVAENDRAAVISNAAFVQRATERVLRLRIVNFLQFRDGKIIEFREFSDTFDAVEQALGTWLDV